jgi:hypothetical protein
LIATLEVAPPGHATVACSPWNSQREQPPPPHTASNNEGAEDWARLTAGIAERTAPTNNSSIDIKPALEEKKGWSGAGG